MEIKYIILLLLLASNENKLFKNRLRKILYIFSVVINENYNYFAHPFGPISNIVEEAIAQTIGAGWMKIIKYDYDVNSDNVYYTLTSIGRKFALTLVADDRKNNEKIEDFINKIKNIDTNTLIYISNLLFYFNKLNEKITINGIKKAMAGAIPVHKIYENHIIKTFKIFKLFENKTKDARKN